MSEKELSDMTQENKQGEAKASVLSDDIHELRKWLNEELGRPIDRVALARVLAVFQSAAAGEPVACKMVYTPVWKKAPSGLAYKESNFACGACGYVGRHDGHPGCRKHSSAPAGEVVVTKNEAGQIVTVTRQDSEGRILSVIAKSGPLSLCTTPEEVDAFLGRVRKEPTAPAGDAGALAAKHAKNLNRIAGILRDCGRYVSSDGRGFRELTEAGEFLAALAQPTKEGE